MAYCVPDSFARYGQGQEAHGSRYFRPAVAATFPFLGWHVVGRAAAATFWYMLADHIHRSRYGTSHLAS